MNEVLQQLTRQNDCRVVWRTTPVKTAIGEQGPTVEIAGVLQQLPAKNFRSPLELVIFRDQIVKAELFPSRVGSSVPENAWRIDTTDTWLYKTVNMWLVGELELGGTEYLEKCFVLASSLRGSDRVVAVDLNEQRFGWIGYYWYRGDLEEGGFPVIAHSFAEWLQRTWLPGRTFATGSAKTLSIWALLFQVI
jgi:hypothetical protein